MLLFSSGRQSTLARPFTENNDRSTTVFICELRKPIAAAHCAGVAGAVQFAAFTKAPEGTPIRGLLIRFKPWELPRVASTLENQKRRSGKIEPPAPPPP